MVSYKLANDSQGSFCDTYVVIPQKVSKTLKTKLIWIYL